MPGNPGKTANLKHRGARNQMYVLAIETSCDETAVALLGVAGSLAAPLTAAGGPDWPLPQLLAHEVYTQADLHEIYGGVVPELASRDHVRRLAPMVRRVLSAGGVTGPELGGVVYTAGPGLVGALLVGASVARSMAFGWKVPALGVHHLEGHLLAARLEDAAPAFPYLALLVSGGHTMLVHVTGVGGYEVLGESLDDAAGEAFDKTAKMLGLAYPGGAALAALAETGNPGVFMFPRPLLDRPGCDFSFSGLKTAAVLAIRAQQALAPEGLPGQVRADLCRGFEDAVVETLVAKTVRALDACGTPRVVVAGGVGANKRLRTRLAEACARRGVTTHYPRPLYCTDNAAMIALAGWYRREAGEQDGLQISARARWPVDTLRAPGGHLQAE